MGGTNRELHYQDPLHYIGLVCASISFLSTLRYSRGNYDIQESFTIYVQDELRAN